MGWVWLGGVGYDLCYVGVRTRGKETSAGLSGV